MKEINKSISLVNLSVPMKMSYWNQNVLNLGATVSVYVGQPLDTIKTKLQTFPNRYKNFIDCAQKIFYKDGIHGLYAGTVPALLANATGKRYSS